MTLNIVIPVLNEENALKDGVCNSIQYLDSSTWKDNYMITIADNGSTDMTAEIADELCNQYHNIAYFKVQRKGVGLAFREAIKRNHSDIIGYMDVDLATDLSHLQDVYNCFQDTKKMIVAGSRLCSGAKVVGRSLKREITSRGLNIILRMFLKVKFSDAMCGFKFYRSDIAKRLITECSQSDGWFYCAEMMIQAEWDGMTINEIPVQWHDDANSKVKVAKLSANYLKEIYRLFRKMKMRG